VRFWDSSALVTLCVEQSSTPSTLALYRGDPELVAWTLSDVEMRSAIARMEREGSIAAAESSAALRRIDDLWRRIDVVTVLDPVKLRAKRLLSLHPLKSVDALQLGAALTWAYDDPQGHELVCLDLRLADAARREGFTVLP